MFSEFFIMGEDHHPLSLAVLLLFSDLLIMGEDHLPTK
jgi:hypothetical protein